MRARKGRKRSETPELRFRRKLREECRKTPGMMVKAERMPQGSMEYHRVRYIHASQLEASHVEECLRSLLGMGYCLLRFVDERRQPLDEYGSLWVNFGGYPDLDDRLEEAEAEAMIAVLEGQMAQNEKKRDNAMAALQACANLMGTRRSALSRLSPATLDALKRSAEIPRSDNMEVMRETIGMMSEAQDQEHQRIMKQRADAAKQLQTFLDTLRAEMQATLQAQELESQTQTEPVSQGRQFPLADSSSPFVGLSFQRMNTGGVFKGLGKSQDKGEEKKQGSQASDSRNADQKPQK